MTPHEPEPRLPGSADAAATSAPTPPERPALDSLSDTAVRRAVPDIARALAREAGWPGRVALVLLSIAALYLARAVVLPLVVALLVAALLSPVVRKLESLWIPAPLGAALVLASLLAACGWAAWSLSGPAANWLEKAPRSLHRLEHRMRAVQEPVERVSEAAEQVEKITAVAKGESSAPREVAVSRQDPVAALLSGTGRFAAAALVTLVLVFFLLATGRSFLAGALEALPDARSRDTAISVLGRIGSDVSVYLLTITLVNTALALVVGGALSLTGIPNPFLWGALAGLLNFVPYLGAMTTGAVLAAVAFLSFEQAWQALGVVVLFGTLTGLEGTVVTPTILGHRMRLHPIVVFVGLVFWGWLWGVPGALIAVPLTASLKIVCDEVDSLRPVARVLGR